MEQQTFVNTCVPRVTKKINLYYYRSVHGNKVWESERSSSWVCGFGNDVDKKDHSQSLHQGDDTKQEE